jgi:hypothetical protein
MGSLPRQATKHEVEQPTAGRLEGVGPPAEVDGDSTTETEGDHMASLKEGCTRGDTWVWCPSRPRQRPLLPLLLHTSTTSVLLLNRGSHKLIQGAALKQRQVLMKHRVEPLMKQCHLLLVSVGMVGVI